MKLGIDAANEQIRNIVTDAIYTEVGANGAPLSATVLVSVHGEDNAAYEGPGGVAFLAHDIRKAFVKALDPLVGGAAIIRDVNGNTVGSIIINEGTAP